MTITLEQLGIKSPTEFIKNELGEIDVNPITGKLSDYHLENCNGCSLCEKFCPENNCGNPICCDEERCNEH
jgi:flavoprotein